MAAHLRLQGTLALVTGGGSGIGRAICTRFAREGALVAIADCDEAGASKTLQGLQAGDHEALRVDVGCAKSVAHLVDRIQARFSRPASVCVNCAGITMDEFLLKQTEEAFDTVLRVNLKGTFLVTQAVARALVAAGISQGSIINLGSVVGKVGNLGQVNYAASKAGVEALSKTAAKELASLQRWCHWDGWGSLKMLLRFALSWPLTRAATLLGPAWR
ncbi:(3R)-3-hydroxyacyl-CoA dehydrogenase isoform X3 [Rhineura floridana]|uniref:(3R)-3-hydroxyacyl-CoA dehydrogenase isoform X3 n=1 Tax=Rhineura floridana TaxID=261503 RepID=UPI002AC80CD1|nr:(3R)-3-hydroxyacyl-CoA dehydrogenase isoform X3 [Rhineura floridana]